MSDLKNIHTYSNVSGVDRNVMRLLITCNRKNKNSLVFPSSDSKYFSISINNKQIMADFTLPRISKIILLNFTGHTRAEFPRRNTATCSGFFPRGPNEKIPRQTLKYTQTHYF